MGLDYDVRRISVNQYEWLETWLIREQNSSPHGTVLLFPGNGGSKGNQLLLASKIFHSLGYDSLLVDFRGVGGSSGNTTTIGANEAEDIALAMEYVRQADLQSPIVLYGVSMGSAAILRAIAQKNITPDAVILELPFLRLLDAVKSRLREYRVPTFPAAKLLVFWGSVQHGFNGFSHNPVNYAKKVWRSPKSTQQLPGKYLYVRNLRFWRCCPALAWCERAVNRLRCCPALATRARS